MVEGVFGIALTVELFLEACGRNEAVSDVTVYGRRHLAAPLECLHGSCTFLRFICL